MKADNRLIDIIEDHALIVDFIDHVACGIENGSAMPEFVPVLNDGVVTDNLSKIAETITMLREKLL
ncbi:MAG: hypothetical protein IJ588_12455 [Prevotella sp.]|nr:hypothetical protein [Prevotella sp.]